MSYSGAKVVVTGGLGFVGSNLAVRLAELGADVTIVDSSLPGCGANRANIASVAHRVNVIDSGIDDAVRVHGAVAAADVIFNLAGEISHVHSMQFPERDLQVNTVAQLRFLLTCRDANRGVRVVYAGTRQVYGAPRYLPVDEAHPLQPIDFNGVHKLAATEYHMMLSRSGDIDAVVLRLTNVYGPRMSLNAVCQGFLSTFIRRMVLRQKITVFGDGQQLRDPVYVDDAVDAFLLAGSSRNVPSRTYNVGGPERVSVGEIARAASEIAGCPAPELRPFPPERKPIDIGSYYTDDGKIRRELAWEPVVRMRDGLERTLRFYRAHLPCYLDPEQPEPACNMPEHTGAPRRLEYMTVGSEHE